VTYRDNDNARIVALVQAYLDAEYRWEQLGEWRHLRVGEPASDIDDAFPDAGCFGLISAWNPQSVPRLDPKNRSADQAMHLQLIETGVICRPAFSSARDRSWREPSWMVVDVPADHQDTLARRFGQLGTLWWPRGEAVRLRLYTRQPLAASDHPFIDWFSPTPSLD
jgi:hypothetical protein